MIFRSEGQALLPPEPGLRRCPPTCRGRGNAGRCDNGRRPTILNPAPQQEAPDAPMATTPRMKITYSTLSADNEELQSAFDAALERARDGLGRTHPMLIGAEERSSDETF